MHSRRRGWMEVQRNTWEYMGIHAWEYKGIHGSTAGYMEIQGDTRENRATHGRAGEYIKEPCGTWQNTGIHGSTEGYMEVKRGT